jgi:hypothetical protein
MSGLDLTVLLDSVRRATPSAPTLRERALNLINQGEARFSEAIKERRLSPDEKPLLHYGYWSVALIIDPPHIDAVPNRDFISTVFSSNPNYTGWPLWLDSRHNTNFDDRPKVLGGAFEYLVIYVSPNSSNHIDLARFDPKGEFFLHTILQDDGAPKAIEPGKVIDPILMVLRVAEAMAVGMSFAKALGWKPDETTIGFGFRWHKLRNRKLTPWASQYLRIPAGGTAHDDVIENFVQLSLDTPLSAVAQYVDQATKRLFAAFEGATIPIGVVEGTVKQLFDRKL